MRATRSRHDRAMALIAVLLVMGGAVLIATSLLFVAQAEMAGSARTADTVRSRALAWSGVQAAIVRLNEQREELLEGSTPRVDEQFVIYETGTRLGVARLLPVGPGGELLVPEAGKLDLNSADAQILADTGMLDEPQAEAIIAYRDGTLSRPYQSVGELLAVEGLSAETLYGPIEDLGAGDESMSAEGGLVAGVESGAPTELRGLGDVATVYSFEPALQRSGRLRINLNTPWSEELGERVADRFGSDVAQTLQRIMESGTTFETEAKIFEVLRFFQVPAEDWPDIVDTFTTEEGDFHFGRLDINTAPYEALAALPGLEPEQADEIVRVRDDLGPDERATIAWPAVEGIVEPEAYDLLAGHITTRCWTWRLRLAAGEVDAEDPEADLVDAVVYEVVIDLSAPRPRVAYLRDVTWMRATARIAAAVDFEPEEDLEAEPADVRAARPEAEDAGGENAAAADPGPAAEPLADMGDDDLDPVPAFEQPAGLEPVSPDGAGPPAAVAAPSPAAPDRARIGRWTAG
ncbi:MAG: helix-hairpin-helix domain-containing protein [Planctomycetota bacterium]